MNDAVSQKQSQVPTNMTNLIQACEELHKEIELLEKRLDSALRGPEPRPTGSPPSNQISPNLVSLAAQVSERTASIRLAISHVHDLFQRLEL